MVDVELLDGGEIMNHWCIRFLVPISEACSTSLHDFLEKFIRRVFITDPVLSSIGAFELMVFQYRIDQLDFLDKQHTALDKLRDFMILKSITVIEHDDPFSVTQFSTMIPISQCSDTRKKQKMLATRTCKMI